MFTLLETFYHIVVKEKQFFCPIITAHSIFPYTSRLAFIRESKEKPIGALESKLMVLQSKKRDLEVISSKYLNNARVCIQLSNYQIKCGYNSWKSVIRYRFGITILLKTQNIWKWNQFTKISVQCSVIKFATNFFNSVLG